MLHEPGSFRDPHSRVFHGDGGILRGLSPEGLADWEALAGTKLFSSFVERGRLIETERADEGGPSAGLDEDWAAVLRHETVPFVSYPYEWPFGMLKDAALLQLELLRAALDEGLILKDSSPYNVQWRGSDPVFIDVGSFEKLRESEPWVGYRQFCMLFLYPLMLQAYKGVPFQPWLRGSIDGISPRECRSVMSRLDLRRKGVFSHVFLHARLDQPGKETSRDVKRELRAAGFNTELIKANVRRLEKIVSGLEWRPEGSAWSAYEATKTYSDTDTDRKEAFVRAAASERDWNLVWDLGCNVGRFARIAAPHARNVVAVDGDHGVVELLYRSLKVEPAASILPLTLNLADPSPGLGWRGQERRPLEERGRPDLTLCLALLHHLVLSANIPIRDVIGWFADLGTHLVIEFPTKEDPMVKRLLARKREGLHSDYETDVFERWLSEAFTVERRETLPSGTRHLYFARPPH
ncbi:MAG: class I SAM-dependent methyltransferase [Actinobacteria bacterium]|nr:class I SAM-dependent methyltransferase [Actinomycetota bacterium]